MTIIHAMNEMNSPNLNDIGLYLKWIVLLSRIDRHRAEIAVRARRSALPFPIAIRLTLKASQPVKYVVIQHQPTRLIDLRLDHNIVDLIIDHIRRGQRARLRASNPRIAGFV